MGIMDMLKKLGGSENKQALKQRMIEAQQERKVKKVLDEREKSSNERELERIMRDRREEAIKLKLQEIRAKETKANWKGKNIKGEATILKEDRPMLREKNIFKCKKGKMAWKGGFI